jgi:single-stranded DNA-binding protein
VFGLLAEVLSSKLTKGSQVTVHGSLIQNRFETKSGQKVSKVIVRAKTVAPIPALPKVGYEAVAEGTGESRPDQSQVH